MLLAYVGWILSSSSGYNCFEIGLNGGPSGKLVGAGSATRFPIAATSHAGIQLPLAIREMKKGALRRPPKKKAARFPMRCAVGGQPAEAKRGGEEGARHENRLESRASSPNF